MSFLKKNGKLVKRNGKLVKTGNPGACTCCKPVGPEEGVCCVDGVCDDSKINRDDCERCGDLYCYSFAPSGVGDTCPPGYDLACPGLCIRKRPIGPAGKCDTENQDPTQKEKLVSLPRKCGTWFPGGTCDTVDCKEPGACCVNGKCVPANSAGECASLYCQESRACATRGGRARIVKSCKECDDENPDINRVERCVVGGICSGSWLPGEDCSTADCRIWCCAVCDDPLEDGLCPPGLMQEGDRCVRQITYNCEPEVLEQINADYPECKGGFTSEQGRCPPLEACCPLESFTLSLKQPANAETGCAGYDATVTGPKLGGPDPANGTDAVLVIESNGHRAEVFIDIQRCSTAFDISIVVNRDGQCGGQERVDIVAYCDRPAKFRLPFGGTGSLTPNKLRERNPLP
jgi:hypothetical protein